MSEYNVLAHLQQTTFENNSDKRIYNCSHYKQFLIFASLLSTLFDNCTLLVLWMFSIYLLQMFSKSSAANLLHVGKGFIVAAD